MCVAVVKESTWMDVVVAILPHRMAGLHVSESDFELELHGCLAISEALQPQVWRFLRMQMNIRTHEHTCTCEHVHIGTREHTSMTRNAYTLRAAKQQTRTYISRLIARYHPLYDQGYTSLGHRSINSWTLCRLE